MTGRYPSTASLRLGAPREVTRREDPFPSRRLCGKHVRRVVRLPAGEDSIPARSDKVQLGEGGSGSDTETMVSESSFFPLSPREQENLTQGWGGVGELPGYDIFSAKIKKALANQDDLATLCFSQWNGNTSNCDQTKKTVFYSSLTPVYERMSST